MNVSESCVSESEIRDLLIGSFHAAVAAVMAERVLPPQLPPTPAGRTLVLGAGKAAADMAACVEAHWPADAPLSGLVITRHGHSLPSPTGEGGGEETRPSRSQRIQVVEAGHPLPDNAGLTAAQHLLDLANNTSPNDQVLALISGGGSSLLTLPAAGLELADIRALSSALLNSGAPIADINCVRKHLSRTLGGRLAAQCRAPVRVLMISDVTGDDPSVIASGPFAPDATTFADALDVLERRQVAVPEPVRRYLWDGVAGQHPETPKPGAACFRRVEHRLLANGRTGLEGAAEYFRNRGITPVILGDSVSGEAREAAQVFAALAREIRLHGTPWMPPVALISGGETSVTVRGKGRGGRNAEFELALAIALNGLDRVHALAADTDGIDGTSDCAGAFIAPDTLTRAVHLGVSPAAYLADNNAYHFFASLADLVRTGPTRTNANDYRAILIA
jgi:hydroxypyruvate reductase